MRSVARKLDEQTGPQWPEFFYRSNRGWNRYRVCCFRHVHSHACGICYIMLEGSRCGGNFEDRHAYAHRNEACPMANSLLKEAMRTFFESSVARKYSTNEATSTRLRYLSATSSANRSSFIPVASNVWTCVWTYVWTCV